MKSSLKVSSQNSVDNASRITWGYFSVFSGITGLILAFLPYISLIGVMLGVAAVVFSIFGIIEKQKSPWIWTGLITGSMTVVAFFIIAGLVIFF